MSATIQALREELQNLFPDIGDLEIRAETTLREIPDWDSMSSVNLQVMLEDHFNCKVDQQFLQDETTIQEIVDRIDAENKPA